MLLTAFALAADPSYVLLARNAPLCPGKEDKDCQVVEQPKAQTSTWRDARSWVLLAEDGDWLQVQTPASAAGLCAAPAPVAAGLQLTAWVNKAHRVRALGRVVEIKGADGIVVTLGPGVAVGESGAGKTLVGADVAHARLPVPEDAAADSFVPAALPAPDGATRQYLDNPGAIGLGETGALTWIATGGPILRVDKDGMTSAVSADRGCVALTAPTVGYSGIRAKEAPAAPAAEAAVGVSLAAGTPLKWPSGAGAGTVVAAVTLPDAGKKKKLSCVDAWPGEAVLTVCR